MKNQHNLYDSLQSYALDVYELSSFLILMALEKSNGKKLETALPTVAASVLRRSLCLVSQSSAQVRSYQQP